MPRKQRRRRIAKGVYHDGSSIEVRVVVAGVPYSKRFPSDMSKDECIVERKKLEAHALTVKPRAKRHTLAHDIPRYLRLHEHQESYTNKEAILNHWAERLGDQPRHRISSQDVLAARVAWLDAGAKPKTINHRVAVLRHLYTVLDGGSFPTPCDDVRPLPVERTPIRRVTDQQILAVDAKLQELEQTKRSGRKFDGAKTRARFRVLVSTGKRPSEVMRAEPGDVDLEARVWVTRDGKGGYSPGVYLNDDMLAAWKLFIDADAWGYFNISSFGETLRRAGWPKDVRLYNARHTTWIEAAERGADMADIQIGAGHRSIATTRTHYTGVRNSRMQRLSEQLDGRFGGFPKVPPKDPEESGTENK